MEYKEPPRALKISGGIVSIIGGAATLVIYVYFLIFCIFFGFIAIIFGEPRYWFIIILLPIILAGGALFITAGAMGFSSLSKTSVILGYIGSGLSIGFNIYLWNLSKSDVDLLGMTPFPIYGLPFALVGLIGAILLTIALTKGA